MPGGSVRGFTERVAVVTGGGRGIGRAVALQLALEGAYVIVNYAPQDREGESVAEELRSLGTLAHAVEADVARAASVSQLFTAVDQMYGRLDLLVNCAGVDSINSVNGDGSPSDFSSLSEERWDEVLNASLKAAFLCAQAATGLMSKRPAPAIVNVVSEAGLTGRSDTANYVAAQAGIIGLTKALAYQLAPRIRVNCVVVAGITAEDAGATTDEQHQAEKRPAPRTNLQPPGKQLRSNDVARACTYLLSSDASSITGQMLVVGST